jgi:hypothetical protein
MSSSSVDTTTVINFECWGRRGDRIPATSQLIDYLANCMPGERIILAISGLLRSSGGKSYVALAFGAVFPDGVQVYDLQVSVGQRILEELGLVDPPTELLADLAAPASITIAGEGEVAK